MNEVKVTITLCEIEDDIETIKYCCSNCGMSDIIYDFNFCPNCRAKIIWKKVRNL